MSFPLDPSYYSSLTLVGLVWSLLTFGLMFTERGEALTSRTWTILPAAALLVVSLRIVTTEIGELSALAGGSRPLDVHFGYDIADAIAFADALGPEGRRRYAAFQLGADTLAPPAFACFLMTVYRSTVRSRRVRRVLTAIACTYFSSVLIANTFMPVIMHRHPDAESGMLPLLHAVIPSMDFVKYASHAVAWLIIVVTWGTQITGLVRQRAEGHCEEDR